MPYGFVISNRETPQSAKIRRIPLIIGPLVNSPHLLVVAVGCVSLSHCLLSLVLALSFHQPHSVLRL